MDSCGSYSLLRHFLSLEKSQGNYQDLNLTAQIKKIITTFFYLGYLPLIPGTFGSLVALIIYYFLKRSYYLLIPFHSLILILGFLLAGKTAKLFNRQDPPQIVIDEMNGMFICFLGLPPGQIGESPDMLILFLGFIIFRILDTLKPFPANRFHRQGGSLGIMGDDIVAAIYTNIILRFILSFLLK